MKYMNTLENVSIEFDNGDGEVKGLTCHVPTYFLPV